MQNTVLSIKRNTEYNATQTALLPIWKTSANSAVLLVLLEHYGAKAMIYALLGRTHNMHNT